MESMFSLVGEVALVTGGSGVLGRVMAHGLAQAGARVAVLGRRLEATEAAAAAIRADGGQALALAADVLDDASLRRADEQIRAAWGPVAVLVCAAGGNLPGATTTPEQSFFDLPSADLDAVTRLNFTGTLLPCQVFGRGMAEAHRGSIITIASMAGLRPLSRVVGYGAAKAAVINLTQWLATTLARDYGAGIRVNALAPGFFLTEQNRFLLTDPASGDLTPRGQAIIAHTPMGRFGTPDDLLGALLWLASPASAFVTGAVIPVDGGFAAYAGV